jgi:trimethylamine--corrinoid protein Co-methyltransferase
MLETVVQQNAEILAGIVLAQLSVPGAPVVYAPSATIMDMRSGSLAYGSPEGMLINIANIQMAREFYHIPVRAMCGVTDAKTLDSQAIAETMQNLMLGMLSGAHLLNEVLGTLDSILTVSFEKTIIDSELIGRIRRILDGIQGQDRRIDIATIQQVGSGGCFLNHPTTVDRCRERWRAPLSFTGTYQDWEAEGCPDMVQKAGRRLKQILAEAPVCLIDEALDAELDAYVETGLQQLT